MGYKYKTIDLCAGIGGIRRGFEMTGQFENVLSAEIDDYACCTYKHLFGDNPKNDLTSENFKKIVEQTNYDVLLAGFPCQAFSRIGKKLGFRDSTRGTIFFDIADIISRTNPRAVFLENVDNLVSHNHGDTIERIIKTLEEELGYKVIGVSLDDEGNYIYSRDSFVRNTKDFGLPQNRPRVYIMAFSKRQYGKALKLLNKQLPDYGEIVVFEDVNQILDKDVDDKYYMSQGYLDTLKRHKDRNRAKGNGFGYCVVNKDRGEHPMANTIMAIGGSGKERNLIYQPKEGISGKLLARKRSVLNHEGIRVMTPNEWGRLQGFIGYAFINKEGIDEFEFPRGTTDGQKYKQFGNSVSIPVIKAMADFMLDCFNVLEKQQIEIIKAMALNRKYFTKREVMEMLGLNSTQAGYLLRKMIETEQLTRIAKGKSTRYIKFNSTVAHPPYSQEEKILDLIRKQNCVSNKEVKDYLNTTTGAANVLLSNMVQKGLIIRVQKGKYSL